MLPKHLLSEREICTQYITPALLKAGWKNRIREELSLTAGKLYVKGKLTGRGKPRRADYVLYYKPGIPIAVVEAKDNQHAPGAGLAQALAYAELLDVPFAFASNGDSFVLHDRTAPARGEQLETTLTLDAFPSPEALWARFCRHKQLATPEAAALLAQDYYDDGTDRQPRYYQQVAINRTVEAVARGQKRLLLVMATGTGKTYTAFQIIYRLWQARTARRILFLADRNALIDQTRRGDFKHFRDKMTVVRGHQVDKSYEIYLALYQGLTGPEEERNVYKQFSPGFFDLIVVDECHRGSAADNSAWREVLHYFGTATQLGLTATPRETNDVSTTEYFGAPLFTYSLRQGIDDGFLAPYRVIRIGTNVDVDGFRTTGWMTDAATGAPLAEEAYGSADYDRKIIIRERTQLVARKITEFLRGFNPFAKTIVFCVDQDHAVRMRTELANLNPGRMLADPRYVMCITSDDREGKAELENFIDPAERHPVIAVTVDLLSTGVDAQTCQVIVLDAPIASMTKFKQIIGRGTRINEEYHKRYFTILDFRDVTNLFNDPAFDGDPIRIKPVTVDADLSTVVSEEETDADPVIDETTGEPLTLQPDPAPATTDPAADGAGGFDSFPTDDDDDDGTAPPPPPGRTKIVVEGIDVTVLRTRELHFDDRGRPITVKLTDHARQKLRAHYATLDAFRNRWNAAERKTAIVEELEEHGVPVEDLRAAVSADLDLYDLLCHVAYDAPPRTRRQRAQRLRQQPSTYFTQYGPQARAVLDALLDKYADDGLANLESIDVLRVQPLAGLGTPTELIKAFGGKAQYLQAVRALENALYDDAA